jgi:hypothetical protein
MVDHLTTGWEAELAVGDTTLRRYLFAMADRVAAMAQANGGRTRRDERVAMGDLDTPFVFDQAAVLLQPLPADDLLAVVEEAQRFYGAHRGWLLLSAWPTPDLRPAGLGLMGHPPFMVRAPGPRRDSYGDSPDGIDIVEVTTPAQLADFEGTLMEAYPLPAATGVVHPDLVGDLLHLFVAYDGSSPVAVAGASLLHGITEIDWVGTLPVARGRGIGAAVTWAATAVDPSQPAVLIASDPGRPVYERLGFVPITRFTLWEHRSA